LAAIEAAARRRFFLVPATNGHLHLDHFEVLGQGKLDTLTPSAPVEEGQELDLKLVEVGLYDAQAGVGKVDGYDVVVAQAAKLVGKKVSATVGRVLDGAAYASLAGEAEPGARITFEAEAEKPTRAPARKKPEPKAVAEAEAEEVEETPEEPTAEAAEELEEKEKAPAKKRTRRGTRGGRSRKKKAPAAGASTEDGAKATPTIHVPPPDLGVGPPEEEEPEPEPAAESGADETAAADGQPKRKRTRRGSRGGRRRRKSPAANGQPEEADSEAEQPEEYVPMSEWIEDFEASRSPS
jgi:predicted RNA-binding protein with TRAM domain